MSADAPGRPLISANQVTIARLVPMPILAYYIYAGVEWWPLMLVVGTIIGCTDFVDGFLARKYGPTVLGGLLDPMADKIFVALCYAPFADISIDGYGLVPWWAMALLFTREFVVTALRSAFEQRNLSMKTSYLAKVKTWVQMQGIGMIVICVLVTQAGYQELTVLLLGASVALPLVALFIFWVVKRRVWRGALIMAALCVPVLLLYLPVLGETTRLFTITIPGMVYAIVFITWLSGLDYLFVGVPKLKAEGDFGRADLARLVGAMVLPWIAFGALQYSSAHPGPILAVLALEIAVGGLDNLLSHHRQAAGAARWSARTLGAAAFLGAAIAVPSFATELAAVACTITVVGAAVEFWRGRDYYLDSRMRDKALPKMSTDEE